ncbi:unnamed protein product [Eruca vesicaria subsp. sativa]|uniref:Uncharacterized protein n=1 Tax=Eruca vesicaria subsp. sativa TaxID=29727 RepID=A0ABC8LCX7_ERUVS|nr:unnamed protein product [Eruca vesicaria subsp. sativa]
MLLLEGVLLAAPVTESDEDCLLPERYDALMAFASFNTPPKLCVFEKLRFTGLRLVINGCFNGI